MLYIVLYLLFVLLTGCFYCKYWNLPSMFSQLVYVAIIIVSILGVGKIKKIDARFSREILLLVILPFLSSWGAFELHGQSFVRSIPPTIYVCVALVYFLLHERQANSTKLIKVIYCVALTFVFIQIFQQLIPSRAMFGVSVLGNELEVRNGFSRFRMGNMEPSLVILFYYWCLLLKKFRQKYMVFFILMSLSIYLTLTRQLMATTMATILLSVILFNNTRKKMRQYVVLLIFTVGVYVYKDVLFGSFLEQTVEGNDLTEDNIRLASLTFYWNQIISSPISFLIGNGVPNANSLFGQIMKSWMDVGFYTSDIGIVGIWWHFGIFFIFIYISMLIKILIIYRKYISLYLKLFVIATAFISVMIYPFATSSNYLLWALLLYMIDQEITSKLSKSVNGKN